MKNFLNYLITNLVAHPDQISIQEHTQEQLLPTQNDEPRAPQLHLILTLKVDPTDMGLVIGKNGKVIAALRTLLKLRNQITHQYLSVAIQLEETPAQTPAS